MKNHTPVNTALLISLIFTAVATFVACAAQGISDNNRIITISAAAVVTAVAGFFIVKFVLNKIIFDSLRVTYGFKMNDVNSITPDTDSEPDNTGIPKVNEELAKWAKDKTKEIAMLKANEKYRKEFLGNVSHELKTPLFNIQGYISTLIDGGMDDEEINMKYLERAEKNLNRLISIVEDLGVISKVESGELKLQYDTFDVVTLVEEVFDLYEMKAKARNIQLSFSNKPKNPVMVTADKTRIFEVISNLVVNSINYGRDNGSTSIGIFDIETKWLIEVQDNGIGIAEDQLQRVFERFFRVDKSRSSKSGGTGLGLAIVKHLIEAHGELITVKSKLDKGTTFSFTLRKAE